MTPKQRHQRQIPKYRELIRTTEQVVGNAREVLKKTERGSSIDVMTEIAIKALRKQIDHYCDIGDRVIDQARRRVLANNLMVIARLLMEKQKRRYRRAA